ncbi:hypothetical protein GCM10028868_01650 [Virgibacillus kimchii]
MQETYPFLFLILAFFAFFLNILGLMSLIPLYITLPLFFIAIYLTMYSFANQKRTPRRMR